MKTLALNLCVILSLTNVGCNDAEFNGAKGRASEPSSQTPLDATRPVTQTFTLEAAKAPPVDIVFVVDSSGSMRAEQERLRLNIASFVSNFAKDGAGLDYQIFVIDSAANGLPAIDSARITTVNHMVGSWDALNVVVKFLKGELPNSTKRRPEAVVEAIIISDDNAGLRGGMNSATFKGILQSQFAGLKFHLNGLVGVDSSKNTTWCTVENVGKEYSSLAADPVYGGMILDICTESWSDLLGRLGSKIGSTPATLSFVLKSKPDMNKKAVVQVNGKEISAEEYSIDEATSTLNIKGNVAKAGAEIKINYATKDAK